MSLQKLLLFNLQRRNGRARPKARSAPDCYNQVSRDENKSVVSDRHWSFLAIS